MSRFAIILLIVLGALGVVGGVIALKSESNTEVTLADHGAGADAEPTLERPWLEVLEPKVFELKGEDGPEIRELQNGDELSSGMIIKTGDGALATIHFPDGSVARLDAKTRIQIVEGSFNRSDGRLTVRLKLVWGRVWSKIFDLATPESSWEVHTTNAVATVRGTSFGTEYNVKGRSRVIGGENSVRVQLIDQKTKEIIPSTETTVSESRFVEVKDADIPKISKSSAAFSQIVGRTPETLLEENWIKRSREADRALNQTIEKLKQEHREDKAIRRELRRSVERELENTLKIRNLQKSGDGDVDTKNKSQPSSGRMNENGQDVGGSGSESRGGLGDISKSSLIIETKSDLSRPIIEGSSVFLAAILVSSDGSRVVVTNRATWRVVGPIGKIAEPGVFVAELKESVAEFGRGVGAVAVTLSSEGTTLLGETAPFTVEAPAVPDITNDAG